MSRLFCVLFLWLLVAKLFSQNVTNYSFSATSGTFTTIQSTSGAVSPALTAGSWDDGYFNSIPIGFTFIYDGSTFTTVSVSTNGWMKLGGTAGGSYNLNNLNSGLNRPVLAPLWDDHFLTPGGLTYKTTGFAPNRVFTVEWLNVYWAYTASNPGISFQVKLYEANRRVEFIYRQETGTINGSSASVGINDVTSGQFLSLNNTTTTPVASSVTETTTIFAPPLTGQIYRFDHYALAPTITSVTPITGTPNTVLTITGSGFDAVTTSNVVFCGAVKASVLTSTFTQITAIVPIGTDFERITVTTLSGGRTVEANQSFDLKFNCGGALSLSSFASSEYYTTGSGNRPITVQDLDNDGKVDIITGGSNVRVMRNTATPYNIDAASLAPAVGFAIGNGASNIVCSDVDGDGKKEIVASCYGTPDFVSILRNTSTPGTINAGSFAASVNYSTGAYPSVDMSDLDGDGRPEIVVAGGTADQLFIRQNLCTPGVITAATFGANVNFATGDLPEDVATGDIDGDGKNDVVTCNYWSNNISVFRNTSTPGVINASTLAAKVDFPVAGHSMSICLADVDGDGRLDALVVNQSAAPDCFSVLRNTSTPGNISFAAAVNFLTPYSPSAGAVSDLDGDGLVDFIVAYQNLSNRVGGFRNTSTPGVISFVGGNSFITTGAPFDVSAGDIDGDGKPEILAAHLSVGGFSVLQNMVSYTNTIAPTTVLNSTTFCDNGTWATYVNPADHRQAMFAVKDNGNNLGTITVSEYRDAAPGNYLGNKYLQRHFKVTPTAQPSSPVQVRLFFTPAELANLMAIDPSIAGITSLGVTKYNGPTEDGTYNPLDATSLTWYAPGSMTTGTMYGGNYYLEFTINSFSEFWIHGGSGVLPIDLISFTATPANQTVITEWTTGSETNNDYFVVERSQDGLLIESLDTIDGNGTTSEANEYASVDESPYEGISYYRIKQVDFNGDFTHSEWRSVDMQPLDQISLFPNPSNGEIHLHLTGDYEDLWTMTVTNLSGQTAVERIGTKDEFVNVSLDLAVGTYILKIVSINSSYSQKLVITE